jgi:2-iminobutanoate/2-iminopropanoate deaminase
MEDESGRELTTVSEQTYATMADLQKTLAAAGATMDDIVKATVFITRMEDFEAMNEEYMKFFKGPTPARSTLVTRLVMDEILVEIEAVAYKPTS